MSLQTMANTTGKFWTHAEVELAQGSDFTSLYLANTRGGGSWVKCKRVWFGGGERGKPILGFLLRLFWGKCPAGMIYCPKEVRMSWKCPADEPPHHGKHSGQALDTCRSWACPRLKHHQLIPSQYKRWWVMSQR